VGRRLFFLCFSSGRCSSSLLKFGIHFLYTFFVSDSIFLSPFGIMPPSIALTPSKSQIRNEKRKRARQLQSVKSELQKNHIARIESDLSASIHSVNKIKGEFAVVKFENDRLQNVSQTATLDAIIAKRTVENLASKIVEKDRKIASLSSAPTTSP
jgi:hypothetical protein